MVLKVSSALLTSAKSSRRFSTIEVQFDKVDELTKQCNYSNIIWANGTRKADNFLAAHSLVLDFDGTMPLEAAKAKFAQIENVCIVTSKSHQSPFKIADYGRPGKAITPADYFHVIIALPEPITDLATYKSVMKDLIKLYGSDPSCKDGARFYFGNPRQECWYS